MNYKNNGITLISLIVTIITILILAGVSISMIILNDNSIISQAGNAKKQTESSKEFEKVQFAVNSAVLKNEPLTTEILIGTFQDEFKNDFNELKENGTQWKYIGHFNDYAIDEQGNVDIFNYLEKGKVATKTIKNNYIDSNGDTATIPEGFAVSGISSEQTIINGLVIYEIGNDNILDWNADEDNNGYVDVKEKYNQYVWIPVSDAIYDEAKEDNMISDLNFVAIDNTSYTPMAKKYIINEEEHYYGLLYNFDLNSNVKYMSDYKVGTLNNREPSLVTEHEEDTYAVLNEVKGSKYDAVNYSILEYDSAETMGKELQNEYDKMIKSVNLFDGFYVGRYETSLKNDKVCSIIGVDSMNNINWYYMYKYQSSNYSINPYYNTPVSSSMIWGSQYDAMMNWLIKSGKSISTYDETMNGQDNITGSKDYNDIIGNICDLYGGRSDWTLEADRAVYNVVVPFRVPRRSFQNGGNPRYLGYRVEGSYFITSKFNYVSSRLALYIN